MSVIKNANCILVKDSMKKRYVKDVKAKKYKIRENAEERDRGREREEKKKRKLVTLRIR